VIKATNKIPKAKDREAWKPANERALFTITTEENITSPRKSALSVYGTNMLMNITSNMGALPAKNSQLASFEDRAELISGEHFK